MTIEKLIELLSVADPDLHPKIIIGEETFFIKDVRENEHGDIEIVADDESGAVFI